MYTIYTKETNAMETVPVTGRIDKAISKRLDALAKATARSRSFLIAEAVKAYVKDQTWQIAAIKEGIREADQGKFASDQKTADTFAKYGVNVDEA